MNWNKVHKDARRALEAVASHHNIAISVKGGTYSGTNLRFSAEFAVIRDGVVMDKRAQAFNNHCHEFGISPNAFGKEITLNWKGYDDEFRIVGIRTRSVKAPIALIRVRDGQSFHWHASGVKQALASGDETKMAVKAIQIDLNPADLL